jgi:hypothetical protein
VGIMLSVASHREATASDLEAEDLIDSDLTPEMA